MIHQILVGLIGAMMLGLGAKSMFAPRSMFKNFAIEAQGVAGLNTIRGVIGGLFIACLAMLLAGLVTGQSVWLLAVATLLGVVAVGRIVGLALDGFEKAVVPPLLVELVMVAILVNASLHPAA